MAYTRLYLSTPALIGIPAIVTPLFPASGSLSIKMVMFKLRDLGSATTVYLGDANNQTITFCDIGDTWGIDADTCSELDGNSFYARSNASDPGNIPQLEIIMFTQ